MLITISTPELARIFNDPRVKLVDVRPIAAYNGWRLQNEARGGHIPGAVTFPQSWNEQIDRQEIHALLEAKRVTTDKRIIVYGYAEAPAVETARLLSQLGYEDVRVYREGFADWVEDPQRPVQRLERYERLVHPQWIHDLINGRPVATFAGNPNVLAHVTFGAPEEYEHGHIPGAIHLDTNELEDDRDWNRRSPAELLSALTAHGITHDTTVVIYGRDSNPDMSQAHPGRRAGQIAATRAAAILMYAGVKDVRLLDGGFDAWLAAGFEVEKGWWRPHSVSAFGTDIPARPDYFVDLDEARTMLAEEQSVLVSIRSWREFTGDTSGYHYIRPSGRIPGAVWGNCGTDAYHMQHYRNVDNTMREYHEIAANWQAAGITADKRVAFYCGTGWRASEAFFYACLLGWPRVAIYDGGWFEWSADPANPIETGVPALSPGEPVAVYG